MKALKILRHSDMLLVLRGEVERYQSDSAAASALGVSRSHLSRVLSGQKPITDRLAEALGYKKDPMFVPYEYRT